MAKESELRGQGMPLKKNSIRLEGTVFLSVSRIRLSPVCDFVNLKDVQS